LVIRTFSNACCLLFASCFIACVVFTVIVVGGVVGVRVGVVVVLLQVCVTQLEMWLFLSFGVFLYKFPTLCETFFLRVFSSRLSFACYYWTIIFTIICGFENITVAAPCSAVQLCAESSFIWFSSRFLSSIDVFPLLVVNFVAKLSEQHYDCACA
jgi:hypothetical protein